MAARAAALALATVVALVLVAAATVMLLGYHRLSEYYLRHAVVRAPRVRITDTYDSIKTGDLFYFVAAASTGVNSMLTQSFHSHVGVALREGDRVWLSETSQTSDLMPDPADPAGCLNVGNHAVIVPLLAKLKYYTGVYYWAPLSRPLDAARDEALKVAAEHASVSKHPYPTAVQATLSMLGVRTRPRQCFQHTAHLLDQARLAPADRDTPLSSEGFLDVCEAVNALPGQPLQGGYVYGQPLQVLYDVGVASPPAGDGELSDDEPSNDEPGWAGDVPSN